MAAPANIFPLLPVYRRTDISMVRGQGSYLFDDTGKKYLDFATGIAVNALGHNHPHVVAALKMQADQLWHCSNIYRNPMLETFADRLVKRSFADKVFFCSTGTEAVEAGIKMIRKYHSAKGNAERNRIINMQNGFHGRSITCISAGGNEVARDGFGPLLDGFDAVPLNDVAAVKAAITHKTAGILLEPVQGEGGLFTATKEYLQTLRTLCDQHGLLLFFDEVQCGMGRMGTLFAYETFGVTPDIVSVAKGIGNGFPLAACLANDNAASGMTPGSHGSTYGGNPLAMAVGNAVLDVMEQNGFWNHVQQAATHLQQGLHRLAIEFPRVIRNIRGVGLMQGIEVFVPHREWAATLRTNGLLTSPAYNNTIRLLPPLTVSIQEIDEALELLRTDCKEAA